MPSIQAEFGFSTFWASLIISGTSGAYSLSVLVSGFIPGSGRTVIVAGVILSLGATWLLVIGSSVLFVTLVATIISFGVGLYLPRGLSILTNVSTDKSRAAFFAIHESASTFGIALGPIFAGWILNLLNWRWAVGLWPLVGVASLLLFWAVGKHQGCEVGQRTRDSIGSLQASALEINSNFGAGNRLQWHRVIAYCWVSGSAFTAIMGLASMLPLILVSAWSVDPAQSAEIAGNTRLWGLLGLAGVTFLGGRFGSSRLTIVSMWLTGFAVVALFLAPFGSVFVLILILLAVVSSGLPPLIFSVLATECSGATRDKVNGLVSSVGTIIATVIIPAVLGWLLEHFSVYVMSATLSIIVISGSALSTWLFRGRSKHVGQGSVISARQSGLA